jgi:hypothetical protein
MTESLVPLSSLGVGQKFQTSPPAETGFMVVKLESTFADTVHMETDSVPVVSRSSLFPIVSTMPGSSLVRLEPYLMQPTLENTPTDARVRIGIGEGSFEGITVSGMILVPKDPTKPVAIHDDSIADCFGIFCPEGYRFVLDVGADRIIALPEGTIVQIL